MRVPLSWLKDYTQSQQITIPTKELADKMTMTGTKAEYIELLGHDITNVVVGKILEIEKHPDADKLVVTQIDVGIRAGEPDQSSDVEDLNRLNRLDHQMNGEKLPIQIVTGAKNIKVGDYIPVALNGSTLANGVKIKKGKLRGIESNGMLCSIEELGFTRNEYPEAPEDGIYIFETPHALGRDAAEVLHIKDEIIEFELTSNRVDCYCITGIAREALATINEDFHIPVRYMKYVGTQEYNQTSQDLLSVEVNTDNCTRYMGAVVKDVVVKPSPIWLRQRLLKVGIRPINNIVDITNYVMLEHGQAMHAFDFDTIKDGKIIVRNANDGEKFTTLDGIERELDSTMMIIGDPEKSLAIGGVMGGENSKVTEKTTTILFESAHFEPLSIRKTSKKLGLKTDASIRYERGLDPNKTKKCLQRAIELIEALDCGKVLKGLVDDYKTPLEEHKIVFDIRDINKILGTDLHNYNARKIMGLIGGSTTTDTKSLFAVIPTFRQDVKTIADLAEEIGRFTGYDNIPVELPDTSQTVGKKTKKQEIETIISNTLIGLGLSEAMTYSFESPKVFEKLNIKEDKELTNYVEISNPLGEDFSVMRTTTLNGLLSAISTNYNRRNDSSWLFEISNVYFKNEVAGKAPVEKLKLSFAMYGNCDFYNAKGIIEAVFDRLGIDEVFETEKNLPFAHSGRSAKINLGDENLGFLCEIHPEVLERYSIGSKVYFCTVDIETIINNVNLYNKYKPLPKFPGIKRDIALLAKDEIPSREIEKIISKNGGKLLESVEVFDVYKDSKIGKDFKSIAYSLMFRAENRTLSEEDVAKPMEMILAKLKEELDISLRM